MNIVIAKNAGFCFGVKRATDALEDRLKNIRPGEKIYTLGTLIHNETYNRELYEAGVRVTDISSIQALAADASESAPVTVFVRAHGIPKQDEEALRKCSESNPFFTYCDCTCPFVKKIHNIAAGNSEPDKHFILLGTQTHPEVVGIMSYFDYDKDVIASAEELIELAKTEKGENILQKTPILAAQTTQNLAEWKKSQKILKKL